LLVSSSSFLSSVKKHKAVAVFTSRDAAGTQSSAPHKRGTPPPLLPSASRTSKRRKKTQRNDVTRENGLLANGEIVKERRPRRLEREAKNMMKKQIKRSKNIYLKHDGK